MDRTQLINFGNGLAGAGRGNLGVPLLLLVMMGMMMLSVPPFLLDLLFTFNIALSIVVLLVSVACGTINGFIVTDDPAGRHADATRA